MSDTQKKWYITGGRRATQTDRDVEPIVCYGKDRLDAVTNSGITVWSEDEWQEAKERTATLPFPPLGASSMADLFSETRTKPDKK